ncbi:hypothetical protein ACP4OV_011954 [Aristida adscensionis]
MAAAAAQGGAPEAGVEEQQQPQGESRKLFVGGLPSAAQEAKLEAHFARYGAVRSILVIRDRESGHGRGFGFVEFEEESAAARALADVDAPGHVICGRNGVDVKRARTRLQRQHGDSHVQHQQTHGDGQPPALNGNEDIAHTVSYDSRKVFIGGLRDNITEEEFKAYFETFGTVTDAVVIYDSLTNRSRGFGFVTFDSEEAVNKVMKQSFHILNGTKVEVKIAIPKDEQYYRNRQSRAVRSFSGRDNMAYEGSAYQPVSARYGIYNGYMPQPPVPAQLYYPPYFAMAGYPYGGAYPSQGGVMTNVTGMTARRVPLVYGTYPQMYPGGYNIMYRAGFGGAATYQHGINGATDIKGQNTADIQHVDSTAGIATRLEHMKLGSQ